ncbi:hypothetical protein BDI4_120030 [Burkholderia diffusa]|nr:hypothetical protein BDI4_120030 [Burkholderia diffusa]
MGGQGRLGGVPGNGGGRGGVARRGPHRADRRGRQPQGIHAGPGLSAAGRFRGPLGDDRGREEVLRAAREVVMRATAAEVSSSDRRAPGGGCVFDRPQAKPVARLATARIATCGACAANRHRRNNR